MILNLAKLILMKQLCPGEGTNRDKKQFVNGEQKTFRQITHNVVDKAVRYGKSDAPQRVATRRGSEDGRRDSSSSAQEFGVGGRYSARQRGPSGVRRRAGGCEAGGGSRVGGLHRRVRS